MEMPLWPLPPPTPDSYLSSFRLSHHHREQSAEVVLPVVSCSDDDPFLHVVVFNGADGRPHVEICWACVQTAKLRENKSLKNDI